MQNNFANYLLKIIVDTETKVKHNTKVAGFSLIPAGRWFVEALLIIVFSQASHAI